MKFILLSALLSITSSAFADWTSTIKINEILAIGPEEGTGFMIVVSDVVGFGEGKCNGTWHYLNAGTEKGKMIFSMFLASKATNTGLRLDLTEPSGTNTKCIISGVRY